MAISDQDRAVIEALFKAMQAGPGGEEEMMALFAADAVFVEPFSGQVQTHQGTDAIRASFREMWANPAPELTLTLERVDVDGDCLRAEWNCTSPVFPEPMRGHDLFTIQKGRITRLEVVVTTMPPMGP